MDIFSKQVSFPTNKSTLLKLFCILCTVMTYYGNGSSTIFTKPMWHSGSLGDANNKCGETIYYPTDLFNDKEYKKVTLIVTKAGSMTWNIDGQPSLTCSDPSMAKIHYISFSGYKKHTVDYRTDCPE